MGIGTLGQWFLDTRAVLAASDAHAMGLDPAAHNPLDVFNQPHTYPDLWFGLAKLHLTRADTIWLGALIGFLFLTIALLQVRARTLGEVAWSAVVVCAPAAVFGFNRGNVDLLIFAILSAVAPCLGSKREAVRWIAVAAIITATAMKYYPAATAALLLVPNRPRREILAQLTVTLLAFLAFGLTELDSIHRYATSVHPAGLFTFGVQVAPYLMKWPTAVASGLTIAIIGGAILAWRRDASTHAAELLPSADYLNFLLGSVVLTSCYFATVNYGYRAICVIWMAPFLWSLATRDEIRLPVRGTARFAIGCFVAFLWLDAIGCLLLNTAWPQTQDSVDEWANRLALLRVPVIMYLVGWLLRFVVPFIANGLHALAKGGTGPDSRATSEAAPQRS